MLDIPEGVVDLPHAVEFIDLEEVLQIGVLIEVGVLLEEAHLHEVVIEELFIDDLFYDIRILEDEFHQSAVTHATGGVGVVGLLGFGRHIASAQLTVLMVHIPLVAL